MSEKPQNLYDGIVVAVGHKQFIELGIDEVQALGKGRSVIFDVKGLFPKTATDGRF